MKRLYIMRHAKAVKEHPNGDYDRPLHAVGRNAAMLVGRHMLAQGKIPEALYTSSAIRTRETAKIIASSLGDKITVQEARRLYLASAGELLEFVNSLDDNLNSVMIVAHNPGVQQLGLLLAGSGDNEALMILHQGMLTGTLLSLDIPVKNWERIQPGDGILQALVAPKALGENA